MDAGLFSAINAAITFANFLVGLADVPKEARIFCRLIQRVRLDSEEAIRLLANPTVESHLAADPREKDYIEGTIRDTREELGSIGQWVEEIRVDEQRGGTVSLNKRLQWVWGHQSKLTTRERALSTCHQSLLASMQTMKLWVHGSTSAVAAAARQLPTYEQAVEKRREENEDELDAFLRMRSRRFKPEKRSHGDNVKILVESVRPVNEPLTPIRRPRSMIFTQQAESTPQTQYARSSTPPTKRTGDLGWTRAPEPSPQQQHVAARLVNYGANTSDTSHRRPVFPSTASISDVELQERTELPTMPVRPTLPELDSAWLVSSHSTSVSSISPYSSHISLASGSTISCPAEVESSYFPSSLPTQFNPAVKQYSSYSDTREPSLSAMTSMMSLKTSRSADSELLSHHHSLPILSEPQYPVAHRTYSDSARPVLPPKVPVTDPALPEVVSTAFETPDLSLPEAVPQQPFANYPANSDIVRTKSVTEEMREMRRARLRLISSG